MKAFGDKGKAIFKKQLHYLCTFYLKNRTKYQSVNQ